jgi:hypothetical protein
MQKLTRFGEGDDSKEDTANNMNRAFSLEGLIQLILVLCIAK